jgi:hypothetical protein
MSERKPPSASPNNPTGLSGGTDNIRRSISFCSDQEYESKESNNGYILIY